MSNNFCPICGMNHSTFDQCPRGSVLRVPSCFNTGAYPTLFACGTCHCQEKCSDAFHEKSAPSSALAVQEGGNRYKDLPIQPVEYIHANGIGYFEGNVIKYVSRWRNKNGIADLKKASHYIALLIELEEKNASQPQAQGADTPATRS